jgi:peptidylprolyl isomerase/peptidyl-prolyl cis-trans isomerase A (cyclophilin A)
VIEGTEERLYSDGGTATFTTNLGQIVIDLENEKAPKTVTNFTKLAREGFYDGQRFHRVISGFMIQGGDPLSKDESKRPIWGTGGPGYTFADEFGQGLTNASGTISMANAGPNTNGSQFFINVADNSFLDGKHAVFGKVTEGMDIVLKISQVKTAQNDQPAEDVIIQSVQVK